MIRERTSLEGKRVLVTGGTTAIGRSIVFLLAEEGATVLTLGRNQDGLEETLAQAEGKQGKVFGLTADVTEKEQIKYIFSEVDSKLGGIHILIDNAGISADPLDETSEDDWRYVVETNLVAYMSCAKASIDRMKAGDGGGISFSLVQSAQNSNPPARVCTPAQKRAWMLLRRPSEKKLRTRTFG
jgi:3-hydroxy acid dehydrogenase/malonic semialdehyde reductase